jgi:hypothetical protein
LQTGAAAVARVVEILACERPHLRSWSAAAHRDADPRSPQGGAGDGCLQTVRCKVSLAGPCIEGDRSTKFAATIATHHRSVAALRSVEVPLKQRLELRVIQRFDQVLVQAGDLW